MGQALPDFQKRFPLREAPLSNQYNFHGGTFPGKRFPSALLREALYGKRFCRIGKGFSFWEGLFPKREGLLMPSKKTSIPEALLSKREGL